MSAYCLLWSWAGLKHCSWGLEGCFCAVSPHSRLPPKQFCLNNGVEWKASCRANTQRAREDWGQKRGERKHNGAPWLSIHLAWHNTMVEIQQVWAFPFEQMSNENKNNKTHTHTHTYVYICWVFPFVIYVLWVQKESAVHFITTLIFPRTENNWDTTKIFLVLLSVYKEYSQDSKMLWSTGRLIYRALLIWSNNE